MPEQIPVYFELFFIAITAAAGWFFLQANKYFKVVSIVMILWLIIQAILAERGFYTKNSGMPPRLIAAILPPLIFILACFLSSPGRRYVDSLDPRMLTWLHIVRIPVEFCLYILMEHHLVPVIMTFEGRNFDIFSGITAPFIAYYGYSKKRLSRAILIAWNVLCLLLLINVVYYGILSAPTEIQKYSFEQPNVAIQSFPFIWLPSFIVPVVFFSHLVCIRQLVKRNA
jgi:hypothetical protein